MLAINGVFQCYTLERQLYVPGMTKPYAIPEGAYPLILQPSPKFPDWSVIPHLQDVPNFTEIEVHDGNWPSDLLGCTAVGTEHQEGVADPTTHLEGGAVYCSRIALVTLIKILQSADSITITYVNP
jgi:hypothetical protein